MSELQRINRLGGLGGPTTIFFFCFFFVFFLFFFFFFFVFSFVCCERERLFVRMASAVTSAPASGESATAPLSNGIAGSRKIRTAHTKFLHHSLDISEIAPGLAVMAQPRPGHSSVMKAFLLHRYGRTSSIIRVFDLEPSWVRYVAVQSVPRE